ncbi:MAG: ABC transporter permease subunit [Firmicutes bacterium]|nr:ABC transporter permease subunit [Bacillota bacterium]
MTEFAYRKPKYPDGLLFKRSKSEKTVFGCVFAFFTIYGVSLLLPFLWLIMSSLKTGLQFSDDIRMDGNAFAFPKIWMFSNWGKAFSELDYNGVNFFGMIINSVYYVGVVVAVTIFFSMTLAYILSKYRFRGRGFLYALGIFTMTVPIVGTLGVAFKLNMSIGIYDKRVHALIAGIGGFGFEYLIFYGFFKNISWSYAESVFIDGGGHATVFFRIMLPQALAPMAVLSIMKGIGAWNDYMTVILFMPSFPTVASGLYYIGIDLQRQNNIPVYYAALLISLLPILIIFASFSGKIMKNLTMGGLKG